MFRGQLKFFITTRLYYRFTLFEHHEASGSCAPTRGFDAVNHRQVDEFLRGI